MRNFTILGAVLIVLVSALVIFIKYHPFQEKEQIVVRDEMSLRHIAERNDVPVDAMIPLLPSERGTAGRASTLLALHEPIIGPVELEVVTGSGARGLRILLYPQ